MANVNIKFNNKDYLLSCDEGQQENLVDLANHLDLKYDELKKNLGNIGENKLLLITAIKMVDDYFDLLKKIQATGATSQWGDDLYPAQLNKIGITGFYFIKDWPTGPKPFYVKVNKDNPKISESFDLMYGDLEISSGSTRIAKKSELEDRMKNKGMKIDTFGYHLVFLIMVFHRMRDVELVLKD